ncbi:MAG: sodium/panthothenate symporter [Candidatus Bathyarchaeota archaeon BA1]|nr:MAG: sodium/panthothenate symporter [Candidatus Bathyarchaeota archaeon BA1]
MQEAFLTVGVMVAYLALVLVVGVAARLKGVFGMKEYLLAGGMLPLFLVYWLMVGDIYSGFAFLGAGGWSYRYGAPVYYIFAYGTLAYIVNYFIGPKTWYFGRKNGYLTQPDYFGDRYESRLLDLLVTLFGVAYILPYLQLQVAAGGIIFSVASYGLIPLTWGMIISFVVAWIYVFTSGLRGTAWTSVIQSIIMITFAILAATFVIPILYGSLGAMFSEIAKTSPKHLILGAIPGMGYTWYVSTVLMCAFGFWCWPHLFQNSFAIKDVQTLKRGAVLYPLYTYMIAATALLGFAAILKMPGLAVPDEAIMEITKMVFPWWFVGLVGAAGLAAAMTTSDTLCLVSAGLLGRNIYHKLIEPEASDAKVTKVTRIMTVVLLVITLALCIYAPGMLVYLLLMGYSGVTQFFPGVVLGYYWKRASKYGTLTGLLVGEAVAAYFLFGPVRHPYGIFAGFLGLLINFPIAILVSLITKPAKEETLKRFELI